MKSTDKPGLPTSKGGTPKSTSPSSGLRKYYDPRKWGRGGLWDGTPPTGFLWLWMGRLRRWKRRFFVALTPGILLYYKSASKKGRSWTINLHGATIASSRSNERQFTVCASSGGNYYLRAGNKREREPWVDCLQKSINSFSTMLERASALMGQQAGAVAEGTAVPLARRMLSSRALGPALPGPEEQRILTRISTRMQAKTEALEQHKRAVEMQLSSLQHSLVSLASGLQLFPHPAAMPTTPGSTIPSTPPFAPSDPPLYSAATPPLGFRPPEAARGATFDSLVSESGRVVGLGEPSRGEAGLNGPSTSAAGSVRESRDDVFLDAEERWQDAGQSQASTSGSVGAEPPYYRQQPLRTAESFLSAVSEIPAPPVQLGAAGGQLPALWRAYWEAVQGAIREEVVRVTELEAENSALKASVKEYKERARREHQQRRMLSRQGGSAIPEPGPDEDEEEEDDEEGSSSHDDSPTDDETPYELTNGDHAAEVALRARLVSGREEDFFEALEALEVVQTHGYVVKTASRKNELERSLSFSQPPDTGEPELEYASEDNALERPGTPRQKEAREEAEIRERLPVPRPLRRGFSIWSVLKNAIGRDLTHITMPATINEPLSALQRLAEDVEYHCHIGRALQAALGPDRMLQVALFALSSYSSAVLRDCKPFNPLLGETFEWTAPDRSMRFLCEQVSHHPPISCCYVEGGEPGDWSAAEGPAAGHDPAWRFWSELELRSKFWGKSVEMLPTGQCWLELAPGGAGAAGRELYAWNKVVCGINNIIMGKLWIEWYGELTVKNFATGEYATITLQKCGGNLESRGAITGKVFSADGKPAYSLSGSYMGSIFATAVPQDPSAAAPAPQLVYSCTPLPEDAELQYNMTRFAIALNDPAEELVPQLPPTDSRLRPDQRALEDGIVDLATSEKLRLEEKQREARKQRKAKGVEYEPSWFRKRASAGAELVCPATRLGGESAWQFAGDYWAARRASDWSRCPEIYSD